MKLRPWLVLLSLLASSIVLGQEKKECSWSMKQAGVPGAPIRVSPAIFKVFLKETPAGISPNPDFKGVVALKVISDERGEIIDACALGNPEDSLVGPAIQTAKTWKTRPYFLNQKPEKIESVVGVRFEGKSITFEPLKSVLEAKN
jgi:hypothetical protein